MKILATSDWQDAIQRKGLAQSYMVSLRRKGYLYVRLDGNILEIIPNMKTDRYKNHNIEAVVDKLVVKEEDEERIRKSVATAMKQGDGMVMVLEKGAKEAKTYSKRLMDPVTGIQQQMYNAMVNAMAQKMSH